VLLPPSFRTADHHYLLFFPQLDYYLADLVIDNTPHKAHHVPSSAVNITLFIEPSTESKEKGNNINVLTYLSANSSVAFLGVPLKIGITTVSSPQLNLGSSVSSYPDTLFYLTSKIDKSVYLSKETEAWGQYSTSWILSLVPKPPSSSTSSSSPPSSSSPLYLLQSSHGYFLCLQGTKLVGKEITKEQALNDRSCHFDFSPADQ
jgi:hypothetical protein